MILSLVAKTNVDESFQFRFVLERQPFIVQCYFYDTINVIASNNKLQLILVFPTKFSTKHINKILPSVQLRIFLSNEIKPISCFCR